MHWLARYAKELWNDTVASLNATGNVADPADVTETPTTQPSGSQLPEPEVDEVTDTAEIARTRALLDEAIQNHMSALYETPLVTIDWVVIAENVDDSLNHILHPAMSSGMTSWKLLGLSMHGLRYFAALGSS